jgi:hypothetical protein
MSLIGQWRTELETRTAAGTLKVLFHYGDRKERKRRTASELRRYDVSDAPSDVPHCSILYSNVMYTINFLLD